MHIPSHFLSGIPDRAEGDQPFFWDVSYNSSTAAACAIYNFQKCVFLLFLRVSELVSPVAPLPTRQTALFVCYKPYSHQNTPTPLPLYVFCIISPVEKTPLCFRSGDADNPLEVHDPTLLWSGGLDVGRKASIQQGRDLEANRIEVRANVAAASSLLRGCGREFTKHDKAHISVGR